MTEEEKIEQRYEQIRKKIGMSKSVSDTTVYYLLSYEVINNMIKNIGGKNHERKVKDSFIRI